jgi:hypothetical protein
VLANPLEEAVVIWTFTSKSSSRLGSCKFML